MTPRQQELNFERQGFEAVASSAPSVKVLTQPTSISNPTNWTVSSIRSALDEHELGNFASSALLANSFDRDDRIAPCIDDRVNALVGAGAAEFSIQPSEQHVSRSKAVISRLDWWHQTVTSPWMRAALKDGIKLGVSLSRIPWVRTGRAWYPGKPIRWNPEHVWFSESEGLYMANTTEGTQPILPDDPHWFLYEPGGEQSWMAGAVRGLGIPYMMRQFDYKDWARYNERHGLPIIVIREPSGSNNPGTKANFYQGVKRMGSTGIVRAPQGTSEFDSFGLDLLEAKSRSFDSFDKFLDRLNVAIAIYLKGQNLTTEVQGGAYASTGWHMRVRKDYAENDADSFGEALRAQLISRFGQFNLGSWDDDFAPWPTWDLEIPEDQNQVSDGYLKAAQAVQVFIQTGAPIDWDHMLPRMGVQLRKGETMPEPEPEPEAGDDPEGNEDDPKDDGDRDPKPQNRGKGARFRAAAKPDGFVEGQLFVDALTERTITRAEAALRPTLDAVLEELDAAVDYDDLRERLAARYDALDPEDISDLCHKAMVLAELAGRTASMQDQ